MALFFIFRSFNFMKYFLVLIALVFINTIKAQPLEKNDFVVELGMGYPNLSYFKSNIGNLFHFNGLGTNQNEEHKSIGQFIANSEFLLTDKLGFSLGVNYGYYYDYNEVSTTVYDGNSNTSTTQTYFYERKTNRLRIYLGPTFHLLRTDRVDSYLGIKLGIKQNFYDYNSNDPNPNFNTELNLFPVGFRLSYGFRIFLTEYWAIHAKLGLGGPAVSFGLTYKLTE